MKNKNKSFSLTRSDFGKKGWLVILFSFICILIDSSIINDSLNITVEAFSDIKGWDINLLYVFSTITAWIAVLGAAFWGVLSHRISARFAWALSLLITSISCLFWGFSNSEGMYFLFLAISSIGGMGFAYIANLNIISNWFPRKKGLAMGWVTIGFPVSAIFTIPLTSSLLNSGGLPRIYIFYGIVTLLLAIICWIYIRDYPEQCGVQPDNDHSFDQEEAKRQLNIGLEYIKTSPWKPKKVFTTKNSWKIAFSLGVMELLSLGIMTNFFPRCLQAGYTEAEIIPMMMIAGVIAAFGSYGCGILDAKVGAKKATIITFIVAIIAITLNIIPTRITLYLSLPFLGFMLGGAANYLVSIVNTIWGRYDFPNAYRIIKPIVALIGAFGVSIVGVIGHTVSYVAAYTILGIFAIIATLVAVTIDDTLVGRN